MKIKQLLFGILLSFNLVASAQNIKKEVLFTIDDKPYYTDEFARVYKKNLDLVKDESQKDLNQYLDLFVGYKLKINKAYKLGLQDGPQYQSELKSYRGQLSKNYVTDSKVTNELVLEGYNRSLKEINASHILFMLDENAAPEDTLKAYKEIMDLRQKALKGDDFGTLASQFSQDPSAKDNKGNLGYFSAFRMVYAFENAAFKTPKGSISMPVRTKFGYHLIKVNDIRDNRGEVTVAHIMILNPAKEDIAGQEKAKNTINDIYKKIQQGEDFAVLAKQFSDDKSSSSKGGVLNRFGSGQLSSEEFENMAFALKKENEISKPFQTQFGWHIMKLVAKHATKPFDEMKTELENKISKDDRSRLIQESMNEKLRTKFTVKRDAKMYAAIKKSMSELYYQGTWDLPTNAKPFEGNLFAINDKGVSGVDFMTYMKAQQKSGLAIKPLTRLVDHVYDQFLTQQLNTYYNDNLENEFPEFAAVVEEYRDGLLLFDLMEKEIWNKSKTDTIGLKSFYDVNKNKYNWKNRLDAIIVSSTKMDVIKSAQKMLKANKSAEEIKEKLNVKGVVNVMTNSGIFEEGSDALPKNIAPTVGVSEIKKEGEYYFVTKVNKLLPAGPKTLDESRGRVINDYQQHLEDNWVKDLRKEFTVRVNSDVFERVKKQLKP